MCGLGSSLQTRPVLYYSNNAQLLMVSRHREELGRYFRFLMPAPDLIEGMVDKAHFHDLAAQHQFRPLEAFSAERTTPQPSYSRPTRRRS